MQFFNLGKLLLFLTQFYHFKCDRYKLNIALYYFTIYVHQTGFPVSDLSMLRTTNKLEDKM